MKIIVSLLISTPLMGFIAPILLEDIENKKQKSVLKDLLIMLCCFFIGLLFIQALYPND